MSWNGSRAGVTLLSAVVILAFWEVFGRQINPIFASYPTAIVQAGWGMVLDGTLAPAFIESMQPFILGYVAGSVVGILTGIGLGQSRVVEAAFGIYISAGYATPTVALIPLFILWLGLGFWVKVAIVFMLVVFPVSISVWGGVKSVPKTLIEVGTAFVGSRAKITRKIVFPAVVPHVMTGLRLGAGRGVIGIVVGEFFTGLSGLGEILTTAGNSFATARMFVPIVIYMLLGIVLTGLIGWLERKVAPWHQRISGWK